MGRGSALFIRKTILSSQKCLKPLVPRQEKTLLAGSLASFSQNALNLPWLCSSPPIGPLPLAAALPETPIWGLLRLPLPTWEPELQPEDAGCGGKKRDDARRAGFLLLLTHCLSGASGLCVSLLTDRMKEPEGITVMIRTILTFFYGVQFVFAYEFVRSQLLCEVIWKSILSLFFFKKVDLQRVQCPTASKGGEPGSRGDSDVWNSIICTIVVKWHGQKQTEDFWGKMNLSPFPEAAKQKVGSCWYTFCTEETKGSVLPLDWDWKLWLVFPHKENQKWFLSLQNLNAPRVEKRKQKC